MGTNLLPVPWARLTYNTKFEAYELDIDDDELKRAPSFRADKDFDWGDRHARSGAAPLLWDTALLGRFLIASLWNCATLWNCAAEKFHAVRLVRNGAVNAPASAPLAR